MMPLFGSSEHWHARAKVARAMAEQITDADAKRAMLAIAENYEKIAKRAEARDAGLAIPTNESNHEQSNADD